MHNHQLNTPRLEIQHSPSEAPVLVCHSFHLSFVVLSHFETPGPNPLGVDKSFSVGTTWQTASLLHIFVLNPPPFSVSQSQMGPKPPSQNSEERNGQALSGAPVHKRTRIANGAASSKSTAADMNNSGVELRKSKRDLETSEAVTANLMARESFSLDDHVAKTPTLNEHGFWDLPPQDKRNFGLLVLLYFLQGIPMGLATGSVPFLLKDHMSYGEIGIFTLASYPYSLKLLWSPVVDAVWSPKVGRRKSWILPIQLLSGIGMLSLGSIVEDMMAKTGKPGGRSVWQFTGWWFFLVFMCATQDIAVDGWALTLLTPGNISYASTAQTVGLTAGQFLSYTVFLAFNSADFANRYFRSQPLDQGLMTLGGYLTFWGWAYIAVTAALAFVKREERSKNEDGIWDVYKIMWGVLKLRNIQVIIIVHLIAKVGFQANDGVTNLKLLDKGLGKENMALTVLIDFPFEIALGYYVGKWSQRYTPMRVWAWGFMGRLVAALIAQVTVAMFPAGGVTGWYLLLVIAEHVFSTFMNTVMFVAVSAFHARIADPAIGGTYMTLLATLVIFFFFFTLVFPLLPFPPLYLLPLDSPLTFASFIFFFFFH